MFCSYPLSMGGTSFFLFGRNDWEYTGCIEMRRDAKQRQSGMYGGESGRCDAGGVFRYAGNGSNSMLLFLRSDKL